MKEGDNVVIIKQIWHGNTPEGDGFYRSNCTTNPGAPKRFAFLNSQIHTTWCKIVKLGMVTHLWAKVCSSLNLSPAHGAGVWYHHGSLLVSWCFTAL